MDLSREETVKLYSGHVSPGKVDTYNKYDVMLVPHQRRGCMIMDILGKPFFNCHSNGGVFNLGHRNPRVINAIKKAMDTYDIGNHHLVSRPRAKLAAMLSKTLPKGLDQVVYGVGGGEAVDLAIKLARGVTGKKKILSISGCYHGHTGLALATGDPKFNRKFRPMPHGFRQCRFNDIKDLEKKMGPDIAAVILETIPATLGIVVPESTYLQEVRSICDNHETLLILDEIQTGFGRTGRFWGFEHFHVEPDMITIGKGMSGGIYPISATVYNEKYRSFFREDPFMHISTFGGSELGCFAAMETIRISLEKGFLENVNKAGLFFRENITKIAEQHPGLGLKIRGLGLMLGLEFKDEITALLLVKLFFDNGLYAVYSANDPKVIQFLPPLVVTSKEAEEIIERVKAAFYAISV
jgi:putrescine aminotransferase